MTLMLREPLPARRLSQTRTIFWQNHLITITAGYYDDGRVGECFADVERGGHMQATLSDACVLISIALQHGLTLPTLSKSLAFVADYSGTDQPASPIGAILTAMAEMGAPEAPASAKSDNPASP